MQAVDTSLGRFIEEAPFASAMFDRDMTYLYVSPRWREDYGLGQREICGISHYDVFPEIPQRWKEAHRLGLTGKLVQKSEDRFERADGSIQWLRWQIRPWFEADGRVGGIVISSEDITAQKTLEQELLLSEERYRGLVEATTDLVWTGRVTGTTVDVPAWREFTGQSLEEAQQSWTNAVHPQDRSEADAAWSEFLAKGGAYKSAFRMRRSDGEYRWIAVTGIALQNKDKSIRELVGTFSDITLRMQAEETIRLREAMLRGILNNLQDAYLRTDHAGRLIMASPSAARMFSYESNETMIGIPAADLYDNRKDREVLLEKLGENGQVLDWVVPAKRKDGNKLWISINVQFIHDENGQIAGTEGVVRDVTDRIQLEQQLYKAKEKLREEKIYLENEINSDLGFDEIIGRSESLRAVMEDLVTVAKTDATVLLLGETGTGKELVARALHRLSNRAQNPFIKMNCAAIPTGLLESELFGAEKGAYTGADSRKIGRLELADRGTLFLDEIGEISLMLQPKLLRVLQDQQFERLGGTKTLSVNFRLIAATNRDLAKQVQDNAFRRDLYYRLKVFPICLPPLRERRDDIPLLVEHFVKKNSARMLKTVTTTPQRTMAALQEYDWPGNIRELENFIERSVILSTGSELAAPVSELLSQSPENAQPEEGATLIEIQRLRIIEALRNSAGNTSRAASRLGLKRTTLQSKMKQLGIDGKGHRFRSM
ncbi:MAG: sigma 54-interacting transcriptional regulator [Chthoniobacterales bacterium]